MPSLKQIAIMATIAAVTLIALNYASAKSETVNKLVNAG